MDEDGGLNSAAGGRLIRTPVAGGSDSDAVPVLSICLCLLVAVAWRQSQSLNELTLSRACFLP